MKINKGFQVLLLLIWIHDFDGFYVCSLQFSYLVVWGLWLLIEDIFECMVYMKNASK